MWDTKCPVADDSRPSRSLVTALDAIELAPDASPGGNLVSSPQAERAHAIEAEALILTDVQIDGDLSDWPDGMRQYVVGNAPAAYGGARVGDVQDVVLALSDDLDRIKGKSGTGRG